MNHTRPDGQLPATTPTVPAAHEPAACLRLLLTVWPQGCAGNESWRARAQLHDGTEQHFASPFELARFVARSQVPAPIDNTTGGLR